MRIFTKIAMLFVISISFAQTKQDQAQLTNKIQSQVNEIKTLIAELGREKIGSTYFQRLKESQVALVQLKTAPIANKVNVQELNKLYFAVDNILHPENIKINKNRLNTLTTKGSGNGVIRGKVTPIDIYENQVVVLYDGLGNYINYKTVNNLGRYVFNSLPSGEYLIFIASNQDNVVDTFYPNIPCENGLGLGCQIDALTTINLSVNQVLEGIDVRFISKPIIAGTVYDVNDNSGVPYAELTIYNELGEVVRSTYSDNEGSYSTSLNEVGSYKIIASHSRFEKQLYNNINCGSQCNISLGSSISTSYDQQISNINFNLNEAKSFSGTLTDIDSQEPISGRVYLLNELNQQFNNVTVNSSGIWSFAYVPSGQYKVFSEIPYSYFASSYNNIICPTHEKRSCFSVDSDVVDHGAQNTENISLFQKQLSGTQIRGRILDILGQPISNARIFIFNSEFSENMINSVYSNSDGYYESGILDEGSYYVVATSSLYQDVLYPNLICTNLECDQVQGDLVFVTSQADTNDIDFELSESGGSISGRVVDNNNDPIRFVRVYAVGESTSPYLITSTYEITDYQGNFAINGLPIDAYNVNVDALGYVNESYANPVIVNQTHVENINFQLTSYGKINFNLISNSSNPVNDGYIRIYDEFGRYQNSVMFDSTIKLVEGDYYFLYKSNTHVSKVYGGNNCIDCVSISGQLVNVTNDSEQLLTMNVDEHFRLNINTSGSNYYVKIEFYDEENNYLSFQSINTNGFINIKDTANKRLKFSSSQRYSEIYNGINCFTINDCDISNGTVVSPLLNSSLTVNLDLFEATSSISGIILESNGQPANNAAVYLYKNLNDSNHIQNDHVDNNGFYEFMNLEKGQYYIKVASDYISATTYNGNIGCEESCENLNIPPITLNHDQALTNFIIQRVEKGTISGEGILTNSGDFFYSKIYFYKVGDASNELVTIMDIQTQSMTEIHLKEGSYRLVLAKQYTPSTLSAFPSYSCDMDISDYEQCSQLSDIIEVTNGNNYHFNSFQIYEAGKFIINIRDKLTNEQINNASVMLYNANGSQAGAYYNSQAGQIIAQVPSGNYYIFAESSNNSDNINSLYNNIDCGGFIGLDCALSQGQLLSISNGTINEIDIKLSRLPTLKINAINTYSNQALNSINVKIFDNNFNLLDNNNASNGYFEYLGFGDYYVLVDSWAYNSTAHPNHNCSEYNSIDECLMNSTPINMTTYNAIQEIDIFLAMNKAINGMVTDESNSYSGNIIIDLWKDGEIVNSGITSSVGGFSIFAQPGNYYLSTDTNKYINEIYQDIECEHAAVTGLCDISQGQLITVPANNTTPIVINIELEIIDPIFNSSFE